MAAKSLKISARHIVVDSSTILDNTTLIINDGRVAELGSAESMRHVKTDKVITLPGSIIHPGFVNAHCHLELSFMKGRLRNRAPFTRWISDLVALRNKTGVRVIDRGIKVGINRLLATGCATVGDVTSMNRVSKPLIRSGMRAVVFHEALGYDPATAPERFNDLKSRIESAPVSATVSNGVSPHAVFSVSPQLMSSAAKYARSKKLPVAIHLCETLEEVEYSRYGTGPFRQFLDSFGFDRTSAKHPGSTPLNAVNKNGALPCALAIHMNHPAHGDLTTLKKMNAGVAYCPGSNHWFRRKKVDHPLEKLLSRNIPVGLGTDSLASNNDLDMRAEARLVMNSFPEMPITKIFDLITTDAAVALGMKDGVGTLRVGAPFDAVAMNIKNSRRESVLSSIIKSRQTAAMVWVNGKLCYRG